MALMFYSIADIKSREKGDTGVFCSGMKISGVKSGKLLK